MIIISRKKHESIVIGDTIEVTVIDILEDAARLGIEAPLEVPIHRREVYEALQRSALESEELDRQPGLP